MRFYRPHRCCQSAYIVHHVTADECWSRRSAICHGLNKFDFRASRGRYAGHVHTSRAQESTALEIGIMNRPRAFGSRSIWTRPEYLCGLAKIVGRVRALGRVFPRGDPLDRGRGGPRHINRARI